MGGLTACTYPVHRTMRHPQYRWLILLILPVLLILLVVRLPNEHASVSRGITISFTGYTNLPNNTTRFALFSLRNQDSLPIRWRGNWVEVEGLQYNKAPTINRSLPWFAALALKRRDSLTVAVGEPLEEGRWRFSVLCSRYTLRARLLDYAFEYKLPTRVGRFTLLDSQQILSPTNSITNSSIWLAK